MTRPALRATRKASPRAWAAAAVLVFLLTTTAAARAGTTAPSVTRFAGGDRYETAAAITRALFPRPTGGSLFLASGERFPDALAAGPATRGNVPLLLAGRRVLPAATAAEIQRLRPQMVILIGGPAALGPDVLEAVRALGPTAIQWAGEDRYATAALLSSRTFEDGTAVVYLASGERFPDAVVAGSAAVVEGGPLLLASRDVLPAASASELRRLHPRRIVVVGGESAVSAGVFAALRGYASEVVRVSGEDRYATSTAVARRLFDVASNVWLATGTNFPDALALAPATARYRRGPLMLVAPEAIPPGGACALDDLHPSSVLIAGGSAAVNDDVQSRLEAGYPIGSGCPQPQLPPAAAPTDGLVPSIPQAPAATWQLNATHTGAVRDASSQQIALQRAWTTDIGVEPSYPVIAEGKVFVTARRYGAWGSRLIALNASDGRVAWERVLAEEHWPWAAVSYGDGKVFAITVDARLLAFVASTGQPLWSVQLPGQWSGDSAPTPVDRIVYVIATGNSGTLYAVDADTGDIRWSHQVAHLNGGSDPSVTPSGIYSSHTCNQAFAFNPGVGDLVWHHDSDCYGGGGATTAVHRGRVYTRYGSESLVLDAASGAEIGRHPGGTVFGPAFEGNREYFVDTGAELVAADLDTGQWLWLFVPDELLSSDVLFVNGAVYALGDKGTLYALDAATGRLLWQDHPGTGNQWRDDGTVGMPPGGIAAGGGMLVVPAGTTLVAYR